MINPNQRIQGAFGDIFTPNTSYTDKAAAQLYAEHKQRQMRQEQMNAALDDEFAKNLSGIRDADIPELTKAYTEWKVANQQAMKQRDGVPPEKQLDLLRKKANMYAVINGSKQFKQQEDEVGKGVLSNPDVYEDDAHLKLMERRRMPLSQIAALGLDKYDFKYKGTNTDFQKMLSSAAGQQKQVNAKEEPVDKEGLQTKVTPYMYGNTPLQFKESLLASLAQRKAGRDAAAIISQTPVEVIASVNEKFKSIPLEKWKSMGVDKPQELVITGDETPAERYAIHQAQLYALNNEPKEGTPIYRTNEAAKMRMQAKKDEDLVRLRNSLQQKSAEDLIKLRSSLKIDGGEEEDNLWVDEYVNKVAEENKPTGKLFGIIPTQRKDFVADPVLYKALGDPSEISITRDGKFDIKYQKKNEDGKMVEDKSRSKVMTPTEVKLALGYRAATKKQLTEEMNKQKNKPAVKPTKKEDPLGIF